MIYISDISADGKIGYVLYMTNGIKDIEYLGWNKSEKEKNGAFVEEPEDFSKEKYLYKEGSLILSPDYVEPEPEPTLEEIVTAQEQQIATLTECILEMSEYVYQ